jgi:hypothetical protein
MIAVDVPPSPSTLADATLEYLLLGDLRLLLDEAPSWENRRWLLAVLDRLLTSRAGWHAISFGPESRWARLESASLLSVETVSQLQRLRDRVAHGSGFQAVAQDVRRRLDQALQDAAPLAGLLTR